MKYIIALALLLLNTVCLRAHIIEKVSKSADVVAGKYYLFTYKTQSNHYFVKMQLMPASVDSVYFINTYTLQQCKDVSMAADSSYLFKLEKKEEHYFLREKSSGLYLSETGLPGNLCTAFRFTASPDSTAYVNFLTIEGDKLGVKIGNRWLCRSLGAGRYLLASKITATLPSTDVYRIDAFQEPRHVLVLNSAADHWADSLKMYSGKTVDVKLQHTFHNGYYNTVMLPFSVGQYKKVFGSSVTAYAFASGSDSQLTFTEVPSTDTLRAGVPYLLKGNFSEPPYIISGAAIACSDDISYASRSLVFKSFVHATPLGGTDAFVQYQDAFYRCSSTPTLNIGCLKWCVYLNGNRSSAARLLKLRSVQIPHNNEK